MRSRYCRCCEGSCPVNRCIAQSRYCRSRKPKPRHQKAGKPPGPVPPFVGGGRTACAVRAKDCGLSRFSGVCGLSVAKELFAIYLSAATVPTRSISSPALSRGGSCLLERLPYNPRSLSLAAIALRRRNRPACWLPSLSPPKPTDLRRQFSRPSRPINVF
jgi:hypothetical protein